MSDGLDGLTAREERLRKLQAGIVPEDNRKGASPALSPQATRALATVRKNSTPPATSLPPRREISKESIDLIAKALKSIMGSPDSEQPQQ